MDIRGCFGCLEGLGCLVVIFIVILSVTILLGTAIFGDKIGSIVGFIVGIIVGIIVIIRMMRRGGPGGYDGWLSDDDPL